MRSATELDVSDDPGMPAAHQPAGQVGPHPDQSAIPIRIGVWVVIARSPIGLFCVAAVPGPLVGWAPRGSASVGWAR